MWHCAKVHLLADLEHIRPMWSKRCFGTCHTGCWQSGRVSHIFRSHDCWLADRYLLVLVNKMFTSQTDVWQTFFLYRPASNGKLMFGWNSGRLISFTYQIYPHEVTYVVPCILIIVYAIVAMGGRGCIDSLSTHRTLLDLCASRLMATRSSKLFLQRKDTSGVTCPETLQALCGK